MNGRTCGLYLGILAAVTFGALGCKRVSHSTAKGKDTCGLLTDAEIESAMKMKVTSHKGDPDSCEWVLGTGAQVGLVGLMKSSKGAEAVLNSALGAGTPVAGVGDSAMWLGGMTPVLVVHAKGEIYRLSVTSPVLMTPQSASTKTVVVERRQVGSGTMEKQAVSFDWPDLESGAVVLSKAFIGRL
ncbi:MAG: hypothetical protein JWM74_2101 [Myxococcaceae bacterium]|nr:hypothetical protein [Myxococcaceae bacterium]